MADTNPTVPLSRTERTTRVHQLAAAGHSNRAIARELGMHHTTVGRILAATPAPVRTTTAPPERTTPTTSGDAPAPPLLATLDPELIRSLNVLTDPRTGALPASLVHAIHAEANRRRTTWSAPAHRPASGRPSDRAPASCAVTSP